MKSELYIGSRTQIKLPKGSFVFIHDEVPEHPKAKMFDPLTCGFNVVGQNDYRSATAFVEMMDCVFDRGNSTLTKDTGLDFIYEALERNPKSLETLIEPPGKNAPSGHVWAYSKVQRILRSPVLRRALCSKRDFSFNGPNKKVLVRLNRAERGDFDARVLAYSIIARCDGTVIIHNLDFYARDLLVPLVREDRLIAGVRSLETVRRKAPELYDELLQIENKYASGAMFEDAQVLARCAGLRPDPLREDNPYNQFIDEAMK